MVGDNLRNLYAELPSGVKLVAVSKFHPVSRLMEAYDAGQRLFGENRPQELAQKVPQMPSDVEWHFIGHLQTNKLKLVLPYVSLVQSVDSLHLLEAIDKWGRENGRTIDVLLELHLGAEETKHGLSETDIDAVISGEVEKSSIRIRGLMGMATNTEDEAVVEADFARIQALFQRIRTEHPELRDTFTELSIGMSGDWPIAVRHGATMVRIGTDIFGEREY
ncbi:MAG: YggS family pyridoxal phosphate-dependent enzyme [Bacteroidales bacterium]|nr:YggS family pyridoxal phosphate-dependent enzyme [Bacteroidales bacterium]MBR6864767.1 YggS family pyridoxal phosphate-dependent enzyme [Bacteroidales bacterium]